MNFRVDGSSPRYLDNVTVVSGTTYTGDLLLLYGVNTISIQVFCTNGGAGTLNVDATNQDVANALFITPTSQAVAANGAAYVTYAPTDQVTGMRSMRLRFVASAAGNVTVAINMRRLSA